MMAAQLLTRRGRHYCSSFPALVPIRIASSCHFSTHIRSFETADPSNNDDNPSTPKTRPQSFVQSDIQLELGELETELPPGYHQKYHRKQRGVHKPRHEKDGRDSYWRPPWRSPRAEIISAEDYANRPRVTFSESFATMHDAMAVLSWMTQKDKDGMYNLYLDMMTAIAGKSENKGGQKQKDGNKDVMDDEWSVLSTNTSHEYVVRVVAQQYNVTTSRAAGVIQLQHNEEQLKKDPNFTVNHKLQADVDAKVRENIRQIYQSYREKDPLQFTEDPVASTGRIGREDTGSPAFVAASELTDVDALLKKTRRAEIEAAEVRIAKHVYVEDVDERTRKVKLDKEANRLLKMGKELGSLYEQLEYGVDEDDEDEIENAEDNEKGAPVESAQKKEGSDGEGAAKEASVDSAEKKEGSDEAKETETPPPTKSVKKKYPAKRRTKVPRGKIPLKPAGASPYPDNNRGYNETPETRRPRWKYAAQIINTHMLENPTDSSRHGKSVAKRAKGRRHGRIVDGNTIIEQDGKLRVASVAELEQTSWKHVRDESEFMFKGVKEAWLKRQLEGEVDGWGVQEEVFKTAEPELIEGKDEEGGGDDAEGEEKDGEAAADDSDDKKE
ncbi:hypothetical protein ACHAXR_013556 [Thalassiosira sp. AJA248-18]